MKIRAIKEAEANAARTEIQAKADAEAKYKQGEGIARQRQAIIAGLRDSVNAFKDEVAGVDVPIAGAATQPQLPNPQQS